MDGLIIKELQKHVPFTAFGALTGIIIMVITVFAKVPSDISHSLFCTLHSLHILLSATATTAMYVRYNKGKILMAILIGYTGAVGIATISDALVPYLGEALLGPFVTKTEFHVPFIESTKIPSFGVEEWKIVNFSAFIGIIIGYLTPITTFPHTIHVLLSTWASLFYFTTFGVATWLLLLPFIFFFLFLTVLIPCCISDIIYPLLFVKKG